MKTRSMFIPVLLMMAYNFMILSSNAALAQPSPPPAPQGGILTVTPVTVDRGGVVTVSWRGIADPATNDWIGVYKTDAGDRQYSDYFYTGSDGSPRAAGSHAFTMPSEPGTYEFRMFAMGGYTRLAKSSTVTVRGTVTPTPPPSGTVSLTGEWDINANNHRGKMTINQQGSRFTGTILGNQLIEGTITGNTVTFTRKISAIQHYTGTLTLAPDGTATMAGTFTQNRSGSYKWSATKTKSSPKTTQETPPATTTTPKPARFTVEAAKRNLSQGSSVNVPVSLNNVEGLANMNVNIHYDPAVVKPARNASRGNIIPQSLFEANVRDQGVIRLGFAQQTDILGTGTLAQIPFEAVGRPGSRTALRIEVTTASTAAGSRVTPAQLIHGEITIVGADGKLPGDTSGTGELTALDAMNALKMSVGNLAVDMVADVDRDGSVTARDATLILQQVVGRH